MLTLSTTLEMSKILKMPKMLKTPEAEVPECPGAPMPKCPKCLNTPAPQCRNAPNVEIPRRPNATKSCACFKKICIFLLSCQCLPVFLYPLHKSLLSSYSVDSPPCDSPQSFLWLFLHIPCHQSTQNAPRLATLH